MATYKVSTANGLALNVRDDRNGGNKVGEIPNGTSVNIVRCNATYSTLMFNGTPRFIQHSFLNGYPSTDGAGLSANDAAVSNGSGVTIRSTANGTSTGTSLSLGQAVTVTGSTTTGGYVWYSIGTSKWVRGDYLTPTGTASGGGSTGFNGNTFAEVMNGTGVFKLDPSSTNKTQGVKDLQQYLINIGWGPAAVLGTSSDLTVDGNFGTKTEAAVKLFQYECGITQDGIVGSVTATKLNTARQSANWTSSKYHPIPATQWSYSGLPSRIDDISLVARMICAEHSRNGNPTGDEDARAGIAKVFKNRKNSSLNFNEVSGLKTYKAIIFGANQYNPATGAASSKKMAHFVWRGAGNGVPWEQAIKYATQLVNGQTITRAANVVTHHVYFNGYTDSWTTSGKYNIVYYPDASTKQFTAFFTK